MTISYIYLGHPFVSIWMNCCNCLAILNLTKHYTNYMKLSSPINPVKNSLLDQVFPSFSSQRVSFPTSVSKQIWASSVLRGNFLPSTYCRWSMHLTFHTQMHWQFQEKAVLPEMLELCCRRKTVYWSLLSEFHWVQSSWYTQLNPNEWSLQAPRFRSLSPFWVSGRFFLL